MMQEKCFNNLPLFATHFYFLPFLPHSLLYSYYLWWYAFFLLLMVILELNNTTPVIRKRESKTICFVVMTVKVWLFSDFSILFDKLEVVFYNNSIIIYDWVQKEMPIKKNLFSDYCEKQKYHSLMRLLLRWLEERIFYFEIISC